MCFLFLFHFRVYELWRQTVTNHGYVLIVCNVVTQLFSVAYLAVCGKRDLYLILLCHCRLLETLYNA